MVVLQIYTLMPETAKDGLWSKSKYESIANRESCAEDKVVVIVEVGLMVVTCRMQKWCHNHIMS